MGLIMCTFLSIKRDLLDPIIRNEVMWISRMSVNIINRSAAWCLDASVAFYKLLITKTVRSATKTHENNPLVFLDFLSRTSEPVSPRPPAYMCIYTVNIL